MDSKTPGGCDVVLKLPSTLLHPLCLKVTGLCFTASVREVTGHLMVSSNLPVTR